MEQTSCLEGTQTPTQAITTWPCMGCDGGHEGREGAARRWASWLTVPLRTPSPPPHPTPVSSHCHQGTPQALGGEPSGARGSRDGPDSPSREDRCPFRLRAQRWGGKVCSGHLGGRPAGREGPGKDGVAFQGRGHLSRVRKAGRGSARHRVQGDKGLQAGALAGAGPEQGKPGGLPGGGAQELGGQKGSWGEGRLIPRWCRVGGSRRRRGCGLDHRREGPNGCVTPGPQEAAEFPWKAHRAQGPAAPPATPPHF